MRSILRSTLLASFALSLTLVLSGCEDTTKPAATPPAATPEAPKAPETPKEKMDGPAATPEKAATPPVEAPK